MQPCLGSCGAACVCERVFGHRRWGRRGGACFSRPGDCWGVPVVAETGTGVSLNKDCNTGKVSVPHSSTFTEHRYDC